MLLISANIKIFLPKNIFYKAITFKILTKIGIDVFIHKKYIYLSVKLKNGR
jgi:hypothetical protein